MGAHLQATETKAGREPRGVRVEPEDQLGVNRHGLSRRDAHCKWQEEEFNMYFGSRISKTCIPNPVPQVLPHLPRTRWQGLLDLGVTNSLASIMAVSSGPISLLSQ